MAKMQLMSPPVQGRRRRKNKNKILSFFTVIRKIGWFLLVFFILISVIFLIWISVEDFRNREIKELRIEGLKYFSERDLKESVDIFNEGKIFKSSPEEVKDILLKIPFIEDCSVERNYDKKIIIIYIKELVPYATLLSEDKLFLLSHTGKILKQINNVKESVGPLITGLKQKYTMEPGTYLDDEGLWSAMEFWYEYNQVPKNRPINLSEIVVGSSEDLRVFFDEVPCETRWKRENLKRQVQNFALALNKVDLTRFPCKEYIDLRFNDDIIYK